MQLNWTTIRGIGNSFPAKASIVMPIVGYLILFNERLLENLVFQTPWVTVKSESTTGLFFGYTLYWYYFGFLSFGIASIIYYVFSSPIIRRYGDFSDYVRAESQDVTVGELIDICRKLAHVRSEGEYLEPIRITLEGSGQKTPAMVRTILYAHYRHENAGNLVLVWACALLYTLGFALLMLPSIQVTIGISKSLIARI